MGSWHGFSAARAAEDRKGSQVKGSTGSFRLSSCWQIKKHALEEEERTLHLRSVPMSLSESRGRAGALGRCSWVPFLVAVAGSPMRLFLLPLFHSSGLCYFSSKYSNDFPYFYCFFSYFCYLSSSHYAFFFFIVSHPSRPHPQKRRIKETAVNKTCKRAVLSNDFHFIWAVPLNRWRKILF